MHKDCMTIPEAGKRLGLSRISIYQARTRLQESCGAATNVLLSIMNDGSEPSTSRVIAAKTVLELAFKSVEIGDMEARIAALEKGPISINRRTVKRPARQPIE